MYVSQWLTVLRNLRRNVRTTKSLTAKCPYVEVSLRRSALTAKCPYGEVSVQRSVRTAKIPYCKVTVQRSVRTAKCPRAKSLTTKSPGNLQTVDAHPTQHQFAL